MKCEFIKVWALEQFNECTGNFRPIAYFTSDFLAELYKGLKHKDNPYYKVSDKACNAVQVDEKLWLLGEQINLHGSEQQRREELIESAKRKLSPEEIEAVFGKIS
jgi:hypothetical protein